VSSENHRVITKKRDPTRKSGQKGKTLGKKAVNFKEAAAAAKGCEGTSAEREVARAEREVIRRKKVWDEGKEAHARLKATRVLAFGSPEKK